MSSKTTALVLPILAAFPLVACQALERAIIPPVEAVVVLPDRGGQSAQYLVQSSSNNACQMGVRELRNQEWEKAVTAFRQALIDDPDDDCAHFGLGLAYERLDKLDLSLQHYQAANRIPRQQNTMYADSVARVRGKISQ